MKKILSIFSIALLCSCGNKDAGSTTVVDAAKDKAAEMSNGAANATAPAAESDFKKYDIKSGIVTFETKMEMSGIKINKKTVVYFDNYGIKECEETYGVANGKETLEKRNFVKDGFRYSCSPEYGNGAKTKAMGYGVAARFNMKEAESLKDSQFKKLADETICGKTCNGFSMVTPSGKIIMYGWSGITMKTMVGEQTEKNKNEVIAIKIEENVVIPADKFEVPKDCKMTDM